ncbi:hypothetical protein [Sphingobium sp. Sx8-8]|uniref:hypothetical protein n=1 Tax=Sphingobium sp. Sx8-8 TaxID=2933617 RepID=UPI001F5A5D5C|nr:hypothetical protein [Sphingobium sp. Sx8-8]
MKRAWPWLFAAWAAIAPAGAAETLIWKGPVVANWRELDQLTLTGTIEEGIFQPRSLAPYQPAAPSPPLLVPLGENILPLAAIRPFGTEDRAQIERGAGGATILCRAGKASAGVILRWPDRRLPAAYHGLWRLAGKTGAAIGIAAVAPGQDASAQSIWTSDQVQVPLAKLEGEQTLVLICPAAGGSARLEAVMLVPGQAKPTSAPRGTWIWRERDWHDDPLAFARTAQAAGWNELAIQAPRQPDAALVRLAAALAARGIGYRLLDGDPHMATPPGLRDAVTRFTRLRHWCDANLTTRPVLELDIEPYALPGFAADPGGGWRAWAETVRAIARTWEGAVSVDVPWWMRRSPEALAAIDSIRPSIRDIVVMAYRTDPQLILDAAESWLGTSGPPIRVAIETGPVAMEASRNYRRADSGTLKLSDSGAELLSSPEISAPDHAMFAQQQENRTDPVRISFHGFPERAAQVEQAITPLLGGWPGFAGFRVHGWDAAVEGKTNG